MNTETNQEVQPVIQETQQTDPQDNLPSIHLSLLAYIIRRRIKPK